MNLFNKKLEKISFKYTKIECVHCIRIYVNTKVLISKLYQKLFFALYYSLDFVAERKLFMKPKIFYSAAWYSMRIGATDNNQKRVLSLLIRCNHWLE